MQGPADLKKDAGPSTGWCLGRGHRRGGSSGRPGLLQNLPRGKERSKRGPRWPPPLEAEPASGELKQRRAQWWLGLLAPWPQLMPRKERGGCLWAEGQPHSCLDLEKGSPFPGPEVLCAETQSSYKACASGFPHHQVTPPVEDLCMPATASGPPEHSPDHRPPPSLTTTTTPASAVHVIFIPTSFLSQVSVRIFINTTRAGPRDIIRHHRRAIQG